MKYEFVSSAAEIEFYEQELGIKVPVEKVTQGFYSHKRVDSTAMNQARREFIDQVNRGELELKVEIINMPSREGSVGTLKSINYWTAKNQNLFITGFEVLFDKGRGIKELPKTKALVLSKEESRTTDIKYVFNKKDSTKHPAIPTPKNKWGQELNVGRLVVANTRAAGLQVGRITRWTKSNVWINLIPLANQTRKGEEILKEPGECFFLPEAFEGEYFLFAMLGGELPDPDELSFFEDFEPPENSG